MKRSILTFCVSNAYNVNNPLLIVEQVENLKVKLFEKLEQFLVDLDLEYKESANVSDNSSTVQGSLTDSTSTTVHQVTRGISIPARLHFPHVLKFQKCINWMDKYCHWIIFNQKFRYEIVVQSIYLIYASSITVQITNPYFQASIHEFAEAVRAYKVIFLHSELQLSKLGEDLVKKYVCF